MQVKGLECATFTTYQATPMALGGGSATIF